MKELQKKPGVKLPSDFCGKKLREIAELTRYGQNQHKILIFLLKYGKIIMYIVK